MIKIKSVIDVITNSSSEVYLIRTDKSVEEFKKLWKNILLEIGEDPSDETIFGVWFDKIDSGIQLSYPVMSNLDLSEELLIRLFGKENVLKTEDHYADIVTKDEINKFFGKEIEIPEHPLW